MEKLAREKRDHFFNHVISAGNRHQQTNCPICREAKRVLSLKLYKKAYLRWWRKAHLEEARAIQARYYYSHRKFILNEYGYRLPADDPRARGSFDPEPLKRKVIQTDSILRGPFRGFVSSVVDFNDSPLSESLFATLRPKKNSLDKITNETPSRPLKDFTADFISLVKLFGGDTSSSIKRCGIDVISF